MYFRVVVEEPAFDHAKSRILRDLDRKIGLDKKLKEWPEAVFGNKLKFGTGVGQRFMNLKGVRDRLTHFSSTHQTFEHENVRILGLSDTTEYDSLTKEVALEALSTAEAFLGVVFSVRGTSAENIVHSLHLWTGRVPT